MRLLRQLLAMSLGVALCTMQMPLLGAGKPLGILTLAYGAHLNASIASAGLSVFDGERVSTDPRGKLGLRIGASVVTFAESSDATLQSNNAGAHVDVMSGALSIFSAATNPLEVHIQDALVRPHSEQPTQAQIVIFAPKVLQVTARQGSLDFDYHGEFRVLPEGETYRIYLESEAEPQGPAGAGRSNAPPPGTPKATKVAYFILGVTGAGLAAWGIHEWIESHNGVESPAKP